MWGRSKLWEQKDLGTADGPLLRRGGRKASPPSRLTSRGVGRRFRWFGLFAATQQVPTMLSSSVPGSDRLIVVGHVGAIVVIIGPSGP